jgi:hypothetical protein
VTASPTGLAPDPRGFDSGQCNIGSDGKSQRTFTVGPYPAGPVQFFVTANGYGAQWLGSTGGTGDRRLATIVTVPRAATATGPEIRLDPAGSIEGTVHSSATGWLQYAIVRPFAAAPGLETVCTNIPWYTSCNSTYRLDGLGPYAWPLEFVAPDHATTWSGGAPNRFQATPVQVVAGQTTRYDITLAGERRITVRDTPEACKVHSYDAVTGDPVGGSTWENGFGQLTQLSTDWVKISYDNAVPYGVVDCWYGGALRGLRQALPVAPGLSPQPEITLAGTCRRVIVEPSGFVDLPPRRPTSLSGVRRDAGFLIGTFVVKSASTVSAR